MIIEFFANFSKYIATRKHLTERGSMFEHSYGNIVHVPRMDDTKNSKLETKNIARHIHFLVKFIAIIAEIKT